ncbi:MAG: NYN domain-containing protein [Eggerthellaceae bacterium]|nr:NYN domain-containing protein [Eggerthellaceae bacterium]
MAKTAVLVDGGFYRKRAQCLWGAKSPKKRAQELNDYVFMHLAKRDGGQERFLYRVFYYDCPPLKDKQVYHPFHGKTIAFGSDETYRWATEFFDQLKRMRKFALRFGKLSDYDLGYRLNPKKVNALMRGEIGVEQIVESDFALSMKQKGVDMRLGLDISSLAYEGTVDQIILIAGDSDFVPAAKMARRKGIDFILDPMGNHVPDDLLEHIDGMESMIDGDPAVC